MGLSDEEYERRDKQHKRRKAASVSNIHAVGPVCGRPLNSDSSQSKAEDSGWAELHTLLLLLWQGGGVNRPGRLRKAGWTKAALWVGGREKKMWTNTGGRFLTFSLKQVFDWGGGCMGFQSHSLILLSLSKETLDGNTIKCILFHSLAFWSFSGCEGDTQWQREGGTTMAVRSAVSPCPQDGPGPAPGDRHVDAPRSLPHLHNSTMCEWAHAKVTWLSHCLCPSFQGQLCLCHQHLNDSLLIIVECFFCFFLHTFFIRNSV